MALHPIDTEAGPSLGRLNSMHRRRKSGSGSFGAALDGSRADAEAAAAAEGSSQSSRSLMHKYDYCTLVSFLCCTLLLYMHNKALQQDRTVHVQVGVQH